MLTQVVRRQLVLFAAIAAVALAVMALNYVRIPDQLGIGRFDMTVELDHAGGLYPKSQVTYRGVTVGQVVRVDVREGGGAVAELQIDDEAEIPADSRALVRSASVIGEQYINFVPPEDGDTEEVFRAGAVVPADRTVLPTTTTEVLTSVDNLVESLPAEALDTTLDELGEAFGGTGDDLGLLIESAAEVVEAANSNLPETISLIESVAPVLSTQIEMDSQIRSLVDSLDVVTSELQAGDAGLRKIFTESEPTLEAAGTFARELNPVFGQVLADAATIGQVTDAYLPSVEHILIAYPAMETIFKSTLPPGAENADVPAVNLWFKLGLDPPVCLEGFEGANNFQDPNDKTMRPAFQDSYCKVPQASPLVPRGARNAPCPNSDARGPRASDCGLVFDEVAVAQQSFLTSSGAELNPSTVAASRLIAPSGEFFLTDAVSDAAIPDTFADLLTEMVAR